MSNETHKAEYDPVCGMDLTAVTERQQIDHEGRPYFFCGVGCADRFRWSPQKFLGTPVLQLRGVSKIFERGGRTVALMNININIWEGDFVSIIGASGSGKSTALHLLGLLDKPTAGNVYVKGQDVTRWDDDARAELRSKTFGFIFQQFNLIPWLNAYENATLPLVFSGKTEVKNEVLNRFAEIGLAQRLNHRPPQMSGGEQQRLAYLRAISNNPLVILGDEPTGNLDSSTGNKLLEILINLNRVEKKTLVIVTHDADIANKADEIITIKDGKIVPDHRLHKRIYTD